MHLNLHIQYQNLYEEVLHTCINTYTVSKSQVKATNRARLEIMGFRFHRLTYAAHAR